MKIAMTWALFLCAFYLLAQVWLHSHWSVALAITLMSANIGKLLIASERRSRHR